MGGGEGGQGAGGIDGIEDRGRARGGEAGRIGAGRAEGGRGAEADPFVQGGGDGGEQHAHPRPRRDGPRADLAAQPARAAAAAVIGVGRHRSEAVPDDRLAVEAQGQRVAEERGDGDAGFFEQPPVRPLPVRRAEARCDVPGEGLSGSVGGVGDAGHCDAIGVCGRRLEDRAGEGPGSHLRSFDPGAIGPRRSYGDDRTGTIAPGSSATARRRGRIGWGTERCSVPSVCGGGPKVTPGPTFFVAPRALAGRYQAHSTVEVPVTVVKRLRPATS